MGNYHGVQSIPLTDLEYRWQDSPPDLAVSLVHEEYLNHADPGTAHGYRTALSMSHRRGIVELFDDIRRNGVTEPCRVGPGNPGKHRMIIGNQRLAVARALGIAELKCEVYGP